jgi:molybdopterin converting factor small subunit
MITVKALGVARTYMQASTEIDPIDRLTLQGLLALLPPGVQEAAARREVVFIVNGSEASARQGMATAIGDGDEVVILPFAHGG